MVAPHTETQLTRSLVRVPNSGRDRRAGAVLHDLSRVSSAAALVPITNYLALGMLPSTMAPHCPRPPLLPKDHNPMKLSNGAGPFAATSETSAISGSGMVSTDNPSAARSTPATRSPTGGRKRSMLQNGTRIVAQGVRSPKVPRTTTVVSPPQQPRRTDPRPVAGDYRTMEQLLRERDELRAENLALKQQLRRRPFQQRPPSVAGPVGL